jgi:methyl coenzyme M reductase beta subunit
MVEENTRQSLLKALDDLQRELDKKTNKLVELQTIKNECEELKSLIQQIKHQLGIDIPISNIITTGGVEVGGGGIPKFITPMPIVEGISAIFDEFKRTININEIVDEFFKRGWKLSENNPKEVIRSTLKRHPKLFKKVSKGNWAKRR